MNRTPWFALFLAASILPNAGCGGTSAPEGPKRYPASGILKVVGEPAAGAMLRFVPTKVRGNSPAELAMKPLAAMASIDGRFAVMNGDGDIGAPEGEYKLLVLWLKEPPGGGLPVDRLRGRYFDEGRPAAVLVVKPESNDWGTIDLR
jgi:hypothetical protein